ncbi:PDC sensor domain-containing protein [Pseudoroseicyclus sp. H15]
MTFRSLLPAMALLCLGTGAFASEMNAEAQAFYEETVVPLLAQPMVIDAVRAQNAETVGLTADDIAALDRQWAAEIGRADAPLINAVLHSPLGEQLAQMVAESSGLFTEIFIMDAQGLNVAASGATSDYWQGDEAKHAESYGAGPEGYHLSEIEFDESSQMYAVQASFAISDPDTGEVIGAITFGVDAAVIN